MKYEGGKRRGMTRELTKFENKVERVNGPHMSFLSVIAGVGCQTSLRRRVVVYNVPLLERVTKTRRPTIRRYLNKALGVDSCASA